MNQKVLVLFGGDSPEREVSLRSGAGVLKALKKAGFDAEGYDLADGVMKLDEIPSDTIVFPILHGVGGEDGTIQAELEKRGLRFLGADSISSRTCFDKALTRSCLIENGIPVAQGFGVTKAEYNHHPLRLKPHVLKVTRGGSSIGTLIARNPEDVTGEKVNEVFNQDNRAILEELVEGVEITVPILGDRALPVIEIHPPTGGEFDYENKYNGRTVELCPPQNVSEAHQRAAQKLAEKVHRVTGCRHLSRVDIIVRPDGSLVVLEINTIPGMTDQSLYPKAATAAGISFPQLVTIFVKMVESST